MKPTIPRSEKRYNLRARLDAMIPFCLMAVIFEEPAKADDGSAIPSEVAGLFPLEVAETHARQLAETRARKAIVLAQAAIRAVDEATAKAYPHRPMKGGNNVEHEPRSRAE